VEQLQLLVDIAFTHSPLLVQVRLNPLEVVLLNIYLLVLAAVEVSMLVQVVALVDFLVEVLMLQLKAIQSLLEVVLMVAQFQTTRVGVLAQQLHLELEIHQYLV
jgi:hypothetical protein